MCSATQYGFRRVRSNDDVKDGAARKSLTGPGKPYWNTPEGSTGGIAGTRGSSRNTGTGTGAGGAGDVLDGPFDVDRVDVVATVVCASVCFLCDPPKPIKAAVVAAPTAADAPATRARVNFDMTFADSNMQQDELQQRYMIATSS